MLRITIVEMAVNTEIRGILLKWTNYWGGWKQRWFVLSNGVLAYYNEEDEEDKGCKASINISAVDINVFSNDKTRFDVTVQNEQHWCLKAKSSLERQSWLIAIATSKAGKEKGHLAIEGNSENSAKLRQKLSELKLYSDVIAQQVLEIKKTATQSPIDHENLTDASGMLSATCDTFLGTFDHCLSLAETKFNFPLKPGHINNISTPTIHRQSSSKSHGGSSSSVPTTPTSHASRSISFDISHKGDHNIQPNSSDVFQDTLSTSSSDLNKNAINPKFKITAPKIPPTAVISEEIETKPMSFFASMDHSFKDIVLQEDGGIPTSLFLGACDGILPFFNSIGSTAFAPVKMDVNGNINKLKTKYLTNTAKFKILQNIIQQEINMKTTKVRNSATDALLWLKRGLAFIYHFLANIRDGHKDVAEALNLSYNITLKQYHGWVVKGVFALAVKASPSYNDFIRVLAVNKNEELSSRYKSCLMSELDEYLTAMEVVISILDNFYQKHNLDDTSVV